MRLHDKEANVYLIGGSIPEREESTGKIFNTLTAYDPLGKRIATHRKVHLFDIDIPGGITFKVLIQERKSTHAMPYCSCH